jgi:hypothetical protein
VTPIARIPAVLLLAFAANGQAATFVVSTTADAGPGSLRQAIVDMNAAAGNSHIIDIVVPAFSQIALQSPLPEIDKPGVRIQAAEAAVALSGAGYQGPLMTASATTTLLVIVNLEFRQGGPTLFGGCLHAKAVNGITVVQDSFFFSCRALQRGGAIYAGGSLQVTGSRFNSNRVDLDSTLAQGGGGAIYLRGSNPALALDVRRTSFARNQVFDQALGDKQGVGGAIWIDSPAGGHVLAETRIVDGWSTGDGGAIAVGQGAGLTIDGSFLSGNEAWNGRGGAIWTDGDGRLLLRNSTVANNTAVLAGGGIYIGSPAAQLDLWHSVLRWNNSEGPSASGAHLAVAAQAPLRLSHSFLAEVGTDGPPGQYNCGRHGGGSAFDAIVSHSVLANGVYGCGGLGFVGNPQVTYVAPPQWGGLGPLGRQDGAFAESYQPLAGSALLDAGNPLPASALPAEFERCYPIDVAGTARPQDGDGNGIDRCNVGPLEGFEAPLFADGFNPQLPTL